MSVTRNVSRKLISGEFNGVVCELTAPGAKKQTYLAVDLHDENPSLENVTSKFARFSEQLFDNMKYEGQLPMKGDRVIITGIAHGMGIPTEIMQATLETPRPKNAHLPQKDAVADEMRKMWDAYDNLPK